MNISQDAASRTLPSSTRREAAFAFLLSMAPIASLVLMVVGWLRHGLDLPYRDDWREYLSGKIASLDMQHLFRADNDTLSPVTRVLDALAQRYLGGNAIAYQSLSMVCVLGLLLWLQWKLLGKAVGDRFLAACAFSTTILMLQPDSYWGLQNLAYIQALPLVFLLAILCVAFHGPWRSGTKATASFLLGLLAGLSYISGAFATLAMSFVLLAACVVHRRLRKSIAAPAIGALASAVITVALQSWVILSVQHGKTHRADAPWALPLDADFWFYLFGKIGRSLMLPASWGTISLVLCVAALGALVAFAAILMRQPEAETEPDIAPGMIPPAITASVIAFSLLAAIATYLCLVAAGRANLRPASVDGNLEVFRFAYHRFHFFWVTALWPWLAAVAMIVGGAVARRSRVVPGAASACMVLFVVYQGGFSHFQAFHKITAARLSSDATCLRRELAHGGHITCPTLAPYGDLSRAYAYAVRTEASFVRYFPPQSAGTDPLSGPAFRPILHPATVLNATASRPGPGRLELSGGRDPRVIFSAGMRGALGECLVLQVRATVTADYADRAQLFYRTPEEQKFSETHSIRIPVGRGPRVVDFVAVSRAGFNDRLRLDPVANYQPSEVRDLSVRCLF